MNKGFLCTFYVLLQFWDVVAVALLDENALKVTLLEHTDTEVVAVLNGEYTANVSCKADTKCILFLKGDSWVSSPGAGRIDLFVYGLLLNQGITVLANFSFPGG